MKKIAIINGPNLNLLEKREPTIYGNISFETYFEELNTKFPNFQLIYKQSNIEGELINYLHEFGFTCDGIIFNAGGYTHTSIALADAISAIDAKVIEVHISNTFARESFRHHSYLTPVCVGCIVGFGLKSYDLALQYFS